MPFKVLFIVYFTDTFNFSLPKMVNFLLTFSENVKEKLSKIFLHLKQQFEFTFTNREYWEMIARRDIDHDENARREVIRMNQRLEEVLKSKEPTVPFFLHFWEIDTSQSNTNLEQIVGSGGTIYFVQNNPPRCTCQSFLRFNIRKNIWNGENLILKGCKHMAGINWEKMETN